MKRMKLLFQYLLGLPGRVFSRISLFAMVKDSKVHPKAAVLRGTRVYSSVIGKYSYVGSNCYVLHCELGNFCSISNNVVIGGGKHPSTFVSTSPVFYSRHNVLGKCFNRVEFQEYEKTTIGHDVWIGLNAFIKGGIVIGHGAIVGAYAVVTKDVAPYSIVAGNPAKLIKMRFDDETINKLISSGWWELEDERLARVAGNFANADAYLTANKSMDQKDIS